MSLFKASGFGGICIITMGVLHAGAQYMYIHSSENFILDIKYPRVEGIKLIMYPLVTGINTAPVVHTNTQCNGQYSENLWDVCPVGGPMCAYLPCHVFFSLH